MSCKKLVHSQIENFHKNAKLLSNCNTFWVLQNSDSIIQSLNNIIKKSVPNIATYDFSTLYTKLHHDKLKSQLSYIVDFTFKGGNKTFIRLSHNAAAYWGRNKRGDLVLVKYHLKQL